MKELIIEHKFRHLHLRVFKGMEDDYDLVFTSCDYPYFRVQFKNLDKINLDHYQSVGHMLSKEKRKMLDTIYINHAKLLLSLPKD